MRSAVFVLAALAIALVPSPASASVAPTPDDTAAINGDGVYALAKAGDRTILGGNFFAVGGQPRANVAAVLPDGTVDPLFVPTTNGKVSAVAVSSDGTRVFIGGRFTEVNGVPRANLAAVDATTGALIDTWVADTAGDNPTVLTLAVSGDRLYAGGKFTSVDGKPKNKLAAVDTTTGEISPWDTWVNGGVLELVVSNDGSTVWLGGEFTKIRGIPRLYTGGIDAVTGQPHPFTPTASGGRIITVALNPDNTWFYATSDNNNIFAYQPAISNSPIWKTKMSGNTQAMAVSDTELYLGGHFSQFNEQHVARPFIASANPFTGVATTWDTQANGLKGGGWALLIDGPHLHAGGQFKTFGSDAQKGYARFTGTP